MLSLKKYLFTQYRKVNSWDKWNCQEWFKRAQNETGTFWKVLFRLNVKLLTLTATGEKWILNLLGPCDSTGKESARNLGSVSGLGRSPREGKGYPLQCSGLENSKDYSPWGRKESDTTERLCFTLDQIYKKENKLGITE